MFAEANRIVEPILNKDTKTKEDIEQIKMA